MPIVPNHPTSPGPGSNPVPPQVLDPGAGLEEVTAPVNVLRKPVVRRGNLILAIPSLGDLSQEFRIRSCT